MENEKILITKALSDPDPNERRFAVKELAMFNGIASIAALAAALRDEQKGVRDAAARSLEDIGSENAAKAVAEYLSGKNIVSRNLAADILMRLKDNSVKALLPYLYDADQDVRKFSVDILGSIGNSEAVKHLVKALSDSDLNVVVAAAEALGNVHSERPVPELIQLFARSEDSHTTVIEALGKIGGAAAEKFLVQQAQLSLEKEAQDSLLLYTIFESLSKIGTIVSQDILKTAIPRVNTYVRNMVLYALFLIVERHQLPIDVALLYREHIAPMIQHEDTSVRIGGGTMLCTIPGKETTLALIQMLGINEEVDSGIMPALVSRPEIYEHMLELLSESAYPLNPQKLQLLANVGRTALTNDPTLSDNGKIASCADTVFQKIADTWYVFGEDARGAILESLFLLNPRQAGEFIAAIAGDSDPWMRVSIIELLAAIGTKQTSEMILRFREDEDEDVRAAAAAMAENKNTFDERTMNN